LLPPAGRILDVGCGYGRLAIPLAERGYDVTGLDISPNLLRAARREAGRRRVAVRFDAGSMTAVPYPDAGFEVVLSLWSAFYELLENAEQVAALHEMHQVLMPGGIGVIEGPTPRSADRCGDRRRRPSGPGGPHLRGARRRPADGTVRP